MIHLVKCDFLNTVTQSATSWQRAIDSIDINKDHLILRIITDSLSAIADVFIDTGKTPAQGVEHAKNAIVQLFYSSISGQGHRKNRSGFLSHDPSIYSIKGALFYTECAISCAIFTIPTTFLGTVKLIHQLGGHFFHKSKTYSIGLAGNEKNSPPAWDSISQSHASKECAKWQDSLYNGIRGFVRGENPDYITPRVLSPFIALADVTLDTVSPFAETVKAVYETANHLFGTLTGENNYSLRGVIIRTDLAFFKASSTIAAILMATPKFLQKTWAILYDPKYAYSIRPFSSPENSKMKSGTPATRISVKYV